MVLIAKSILFWIKYYGIIINKSLHQKKSFTFVKNAINILIIKNYKKKKKSIPRMATKLIVILEQKKPRYSSIIGSLGLRQ